MTKLERLTEAAGEASRAMKSVLDNWSTGDLAGAVNWMDVAKTELDEVLEKYYGIHAH